jgi:hypothetical protein
MADRPNPMERPDRVAAREGHPISAQRSSDDKVSDEVRRQIEKLLAIWDTADFAEVGVWSDLLTEQVEALRRLLR